MITLLDREPHRIESWRSRPVLARPELLIDQRAADVTGLRDRAVRSLEHRLRRADDDLRHTVARLRALSPRGDAAARATRSCNAPTATWSARPTRSETGDLLRVRLADGELRATVQEQE